MPSPYGHNPALRPELPDHCRFVTGQALGPVSCEIEFAGYGGGGSLGVAGDHRKLR